MTLNFLHDCTHSPFTAGEVQMLMDIQHHLLKEAQPLLLSLLGYLKHLLHVFHVPWVTAVQLIQSFLIALLCLRQDTQSSLEFKKKKKIFPCPDHVTKQHSFYASHWVNGTFNFVIPFKSDNDNKDFSYLSYLNLNLNRILIKQSKQIFIWTCLTDDLNKKKFVCGHFVLWS